MSEDLEQARWMGSMEARMADAERRLDAVNGSIKTHAESVNNLAIRVGGLSTRVSIYSGIGGFFGAAALAAIAHFLP